MNDDVALCTLTWHPASPPQVYLSGNYDTSNAALTSMLQNYKAGIDSYVCANVPDNPLHSVKTSPEGLLYFGEVNSQYVTGAAFLVSVHSDYLATYASTLTCGAAVLSPATTFAFSKAQVCRDRLISFDNKQTVFASSFDSFRHPNTSFLFSLLYFDPRSRH